jgi:transcriptional regulator with XRE-family HTH domain
MIEKEHEIMDLRIRLKEVRENQGLTQLALAKAIEESQSTLASWENGKAMPRANTLIRLADFLHVSLDYLCGRSNMPEIIDEQSIGLTLTTREKRLVMAYRTLPDMQKEMIDRQLEVPH